MKGTRKVGGAGKKKKEIRAQTSSVTSAGIHHGKCYVSMVVYHLPQIPGLNSCWDVNGKRFFGSSHWKIPGTNGNLKR